MTLNELKLGLSQNIAGYVHYVGRDLPALEGVDKATEIELRTAWQAAYDALETIVKIAVYPNYNLDTH